MTVFQVCTLYRSQETSARRFDRGKKSNEVAGETQAGVRTGTVVL